MKLSKFLSLSLLLTALSIAANADIIVSVGYYDLAPNAGGNTNPLPNPWYGSPNTTFLGDSSQATSSDPDESAILLTNTGSSAVTLGQGFSVTSGATTYTLWDSLIGSSGLSIAAGSNVILAGTAANSFDGSDIPLSNSTISLKLNGTTYSLTDSNSILFGSPIGSANETEPWTQIGDLLHATPVGTGTPEPVSFTLVGIGVAALAFKASQKRA